MKFLGSIPDLLKRHYEKVILAFALVGLVGAVFYLNQMKSADNEKIDKYNQNIGRRKTKPISSVDISALAEAMRHATNPPSIALAPPHNLLNPVKWQMKPDKTLLKVETGREIGAQALEILKIAPLQLIITLDQQSGSGVSMSVTQEGHTNRLWRGKMQSFLTTNTVSERRHRSGVFTLRDFQVTPEGPVAEIEFTDGTKANVAPSKPFTRVDGYKADLKYPPEPRIALADQRVGDKLTLTGEDYIIVAINSNEVVVSARSNDRRTTIRNNAAQ